MTFKESVYHTCTQGILSISVFCFSNDILRYFKMSPYVNFWPVNAFLYLFDVVILLCAVVYYLCNKNE